MEQNNFLEEPQQYDSKYGQFLDTPAMWTLSFMRKPVWGKLKSIASDGTLEILISHGKVILASQQLVIGVGMI